MHSVKLADLRPPADQALAEANLPQLPDRNHPVLPGSQPSDSGINGGVVS
jgi:hypothetical protein